MAAYNENILVSVIVPVYNVENELGDCVRSILVQSHSKLEVLLIDDGSTDSSGSICDSYAILDSRIRSIHKENGGLSDARNVGVSEATGDYVAFVDSDDVIAPVFIEAMLKAAIQEGTSIVAVPTSVDFYDGDLPTLKSAYNECAKPRSVTSETFQEMLLYQKYDTGVPNYLFERLLITAAPFTKGIYYEDLDWLYRVVDQVKYIACIDDGFLTGYRQRKTSIMNMPFSPAKASSALKIVEKMQSYFASKRPDLVLAARSRCFSVCRVVYAQIPKKLNGRSAISNHEEARLQLWDIIHHSCKDVIRDNNARKKEKVAALIAWCGYVPFGFFCMICRLLGLMR